MNLISPEHLMNGIKVSQPPRVLIVLSSAERRGAQVQATIVASELADAGVSVEVVALSRGSGSGLALEVLGNRRLSLRSLVRLRRKASGFDVAIAYGSTALPACALALTGSGTPFVYRSIGESGQWLRGRFHRWRTAALFRRASQVVALWPAAAESLVALYGVRRSDVVVIPNLRYPRQLSSQMELPASSLPRLEVPSGFAVVCFVGAMAPEKRPMVAVEVVHQLPSVFLIMVGSGPLSHEVARSCSKLIPGRFALCGSVDPIEQLWPAVDVLLLTSSTEGMPGVIIEAHLAGKPVVASNVGGVSEIVNDGVTGRLVSADASAADFAAALEDVITNQGAMGMAASRTAQKFVPSAVIPLWIDLLVRYRTVPYG